MMNIIHKILFLSILLNMNFCSSKVNNDRFISENPKAKKYIEYLNDKRSKLFSLENKGFKFEWTLHVYCEAFEKHDGFRAILYIYKNKNRVDIIFDDGKKWTRISEGNKTHDFVNGRSSDEFKERWGEDNPDGPVLYPLLSKSLEWKNFKTDSTDEGIKAYLVCISNDEKITFVFPIDDLDKHTTIEYKDNFQSIYKISYGKNFKKFDDLTIPQIGISEILKSGWCNSGKRFVDKEYHILDTTWLPNDDTFKIKEPMEFIERIEQPQFGKNN